jgi:uncharacterized protein
MKIYLFIFIFFSYFAHCEVGYVEPWGKDSSLSKVQTHKKTKPSSNHLLSNIANNVIVFHQKVLTPVDGPRSNFRPTSSRYMQLAIKRYGFLKGTLMGFDRLLRENDEKWVYKTIEIDNIKYKFDPAFEDKYLK